MKYTVTVRGSNWYTVEVEAADEKAAIAEAALRIHRGEVPRDEGEDLDAYSVEHENTVSML